MSAKVLLPGFGGQYVSETLDANSTTGADTIDLARSYSFSLQISHVSGTPAGSIQLEQVFGGTAYSNLGTSIAVTVDGSIATFDSSDGPFGNSRINATAITAGSIKVYLTGFNSQVLP